MLYVADAITLDIDADTLIRAPLAAAAMMLLLILTPPLTPRLPLAPLRCFSPIITLRCCARALTL